MKNAKNKIIALLSALLYLSLTALAVLLIRKHSASEKTSYLVTMPADSNPGIFSIEKRGRLKELSGVNSIIGTVTEAYNGSVVVETESDGSFFVTLDTFDSLNEGDRLMVFYSGAIWKPIRVSLRKSLDIWFLRIFKPHRNRSTINTAPHARRATVRRLFSL